MAFDTANKYIFWSCFCGAAKFTTILVLQILFELPEASEKVAVLISKRRKLKLKKNNADH